MRGCRQITPGLYPKVAVYRMQSQDDLRTVIKYIFKPIALSDAYLMAANKLGLEPTGMAELNEQVNLFLENLLFAFHDVVRMNRYGICSPSHRKYIGVVTEERLERRDRDRIRRKQRQKEAAEIKKFFSEFKPHKRKQSKEERWKQSLIWAYFDGALRAEGEIPKRIPKRRTRRKIRSPSRHQS